MLLSGVNDTDADARRVVRLLANLNAKVNLIALNPGPGIPYATPDPERVASFQEIVRRALPCFMRKPRGLDIYAACGQLKSHFASRCRAARGSHRNTVVTLSRRNLLAALYAASPLGDAPAEPLTLPARRNDFHQLLVPARIGGSSTFMV